MSRFATRPAVADRGSPRPGVDVDMEDLFRLQRYLSLSLEIQRASLGDTSSHRIGQGMSYLESRRYQQGDDVRHIDWRVTARTALTHSKVFHEERMNDLTVVVDFSPSMLFGTRSCLKSICAARIAALLAWRNAIRKERCQLIAFSMDNVWQSPEIADRAGMAPVLSGLQTMGRFYLDSAKPDYATAQTTLQRALNLAQRESRPGSQLCIVTDAAALLEHGLAPLSAAASVSSTTIYLVSDSIERDPPARGLLPIECGEQEQLLDLSDPKTRRALAASYAERRAAIYAWAGDHRARLVEPVDAASSAQDCARMLR